MEKMYHPTQYNVLKPKVGDNSLNKKLSKGKGKQADSLFQLSSDHLFNYRAGPFQFPTPIDSNFGNTEFEPAALDHPYYSPSLGYEIAGPGADYMTQARSFRNYKDNGASLNPEAATFVMNPTAPAFVPGQSGRSPPIDEFSRLKMSQARSSFPATTSDAQTPRAPSSQLGKKSLSVQILLYDF